MNVFDSPVRGDTKIICLLGHPVSHSLSPQIHNHAFKQLGLNFIYIPVSVPVNAVHTAAFAIRSFGFTGANVTIPHKQHILNYCDTLSDLSKKTGTVNTLCMCDGLLHGTTTDYEGFKKAISCMDHDIEGSKIVLLGNGGTAKTLGTALALDKNIASLTIAGRNFLKADSLAASIKLKTGHPVNACAFSDPLFRDAMSECTLLVNTTSAGMYPEIDETPIHAKFFHKKMKVFDVIYNPSKTRFLTEAQKSGCQIQNGLRMLLFQGLASFKIWTGVEVPEDLFSIEYLQKLVSG
jgi:shikimate dehydrogenase